MKIFHLPPPTQKHNGPSLTASCLSPTAQAGEVEATEVVLIGALRTDNNYEESCSEPSQCPPGVINITHLGIPANGIQGSTKHTYNKNSQLFP